MEFASLTYGDPNSSSISGTLRIKSLASGGLIVNITHTAAIHSRIWELSLGSPASTNVTFTARHFLWTGMVLQSTAAGNSSGLQNVVFVVATESMQVTTSQALAANKYIRGMTVVTEGTAWWHASIQSVAFDNAALQVSSSSTMESFVPSWISMSSSTQAERNLICNGVARFACDGVCTMNISIENSNRLEFVPQMLSSNQSVLLPRWSFSGDFMNKHIILSYFTHLELMVGTTPTSSGSITLLGAPAVNTSYTYNTSTTVFWWVTLASSSSVAYNFHQPILFTLKPDVDDQQHMQVSIVNVTSRGPVTWSVFPSLRKSAIVTISVTGYIQMDQHATILLKPSNVTVSTMFSTLRTSTCETGYMFIGDYWNFRPGGGTLIQRQCVVGPGAYISFGPSFSGTGPLFNRPYLTFASELYLQQRRVSMEVAQGIALRIKDLHVTAMETEIHFLTSDTTVEVSGKFNWRGGKIVGRGQNITLRSGGIIDQNTQLSNIGLALEGNSTRIMTGCIIEYFQFRNTSLPTNPPLTSIQGFYSAAPGSSSNRLPLAFDDPLSKADYSSVESSCSEGTQTYGRAPVVFNSNGEVAEDYLLSFTHNYAMRMTTRIYHARSVSCKFTFSWSYAILRLWIDGTAVAIFCGDGSVSANNQTSCNSTSRQYLTSHTTMPVAAGQHELRFDIIRLLPDTGHADYAYSFVPTMACSAGSSVAIGGDGSVIRGCQYPTTSGFYPATSFVVRYPENVCETGLTTAELCAIGHGVSCLVVNNNLTLVSGASILVSSTGVLWANGSGRIFARNAGDGYLSSAGLVTQGNGGRVDLAIGSQISPFWLNCSASSPNNILNEAGRCHITTFVSE